MAKEFSNSDDVIDSRDVIKRIDELESELEAAYDEEFDGEVVENLDPITKPDLDAWLAYIAATDEHGWHTYSDEARELLDLRALQSEAEGYCADWRYGVTLIRDSYFEDYAREFAEDIGAIKRDLQWPYNCIDWEQATRELQMDYSSVEFGDVTYWVR